MVAEFLVQECRRRGTRLTVRLFVDNALRDFRMWKAGGLENHWTVLVRATVAKAFVPQRRVVRGTPPGDPLEADSRIVRAICKGFSDPMDKVRGWQEQKEAASGGSATDHKNL